MARNPAIQILAACLWSGGTMALTKERPVKGEGFTARRSTVVHRITLVTDNLFHIECRVAVPRIAVLTEFVKKKSLDGPMGSDALPTQIRRDADRLFWP